MTCRRIERFDETDGEGNSSLTGTINSISTDYSLCLGYSSAPLSSSKYFSKVVLHTVHHITTRSAFHAADTFPVGIQYVADSLQHSPTAQQSLEPVEPLLLSHRHKRR